MEAIIPYLGRDLIMSPDMSQFVRRDLEPLIEAIRKHDGKALAILEFPTIPDNLERLTSRTVIYSVYVFLSNRFFLISILRDEVLSYKWGRVCNLLPDGRTESEVFKGDWDKVLAEFQKTILRAGIHLIMESPATDNVPNVNKEA